MWPRPAGTWSNTSAIRMWMCQTPLLTAKAPSYAQYFEDEFEASMRQFGIDMDYRYQAQMNRSASTVSMYSTP